MSATRTFLGRRDDSVRGRQPNFRPARCCINCKHCFAREEYDEGDSHYCTLGAGPRPPCGSVLMREYRDEKGKPVFNHNAWEKWGTKNAVRAGDTCDSFVEKAREKQAD